MADLVEAFVVFRDRWLEDHGNLGGMQGAFDFWKDPGLTCAIEIAGRGKNRCSAPCEFCLEKRKKELSRA